MRRWTALIALLVLLATPAGATTVWESETWESNPTNWYDQFDAYDNVPANFSVDATSKVTGTYSLKLATDGSSGACHGAWTFAQTEFYYRVRIYISSTSAPEDGDGMQIAATSNGVAPRLFLYYDTDHFEVNAAYNLDNGNLYYVGDGGANNLITDGVTLSTDTVHTIYWYVRISSAPGANDGIVAYKVDAGEWLDITGIDNDTRTFTDFRVIKISQSGTYYEAGDFIICEDDHLLQDTDPSIPAATGTENNGGGWWF